MKDFILETVLKPLLRRLGTAGAVALLASGDWLCQHLEACGLVTQDGADLVMRYVVAVALLAIDLLWGWAERQRIARKAESKGVHKALSAAGLE